MKSANSPAWRRLWQPQNGLFWLMVALNLLSSLMAWALRAVPLSTAGLFIVGGLALANAFGGLWIAARLWRGD